MATQQDRLRVYLACRHIFRGNNAKLRKIKSIRKLVNKNKDSLEPLLQAMEEERIVAILQGLLEKRVFKSELIAKVEFPDLFHSSQSRNAHHQGSELETAQSPTKALDDVASEGWDTDEGASQCSDGLGAEQGDLAKEPGVKPGADPGMEPGVETELVLSIDEKGEPSVLPKETDEILKEKINVTDKANKVNGADNSHTPPSEPSFIGKIPPLYPCYLPYESQHAILHTAQQVLEECCFGFARKNMPVVLEENRWNSPVAVELTRWLRIFRKKSVATYVQPYFANIDAEGLRNLFSNLANLRHSAVHREPMMAKSVSQLLGSAVKLAQLLHDYQRAAQLDDLRKQLENKIGAMELQKAVLEDTATARMRDIQRQREELDRREKALIEGTTEEDRQNSAFIGQLLEQYVLGMFVKGKRPLFPDGFEGKEVDYKAERERIEQSLRVDHEAGVSGVAENPGMDEEYYYDSLEEITETC